MAVVAGRAMSRNGSLTEVEGRDSRWMGMKTASEVGTDDETLQKHMHRATAKQHQNERKHTHKATYKFV